MYVGEIMTAIVIVIVIQSLWGIGAGYMYHSKGGGFGTGFIFGFMLGFIGLMIVALCRDRTEVDDYKNNYNPTEALKELQKLKESGAISEQEFKASKEKILSRL